jgi:flagellar motility protein MotE (MotC chaperone)
MLASPIIQALIGFLVSVVLSAALLWKSISHLPKPPPPVAGREAVQLTQPPPPVWGFHTDAIEEAASELKEAKAVYEARNRELSALQAQIVSEKQEVEKVRQEVLRLRQDLDARVVEIQENERSNLKLLAQTYTTMQPAAAALILRELEEDVVVKIFSLMKNDRVGLLLGELARPVAGDRLGEESPAKRAARISDKIRLMKGLKKEVPQ